MIKTIVGAILAGVVLFHLERSFMDGDSVA